MNDNIGTLNQNLQCECQLIYEVFFSTINVLELSHVRNCSKVVVEIQKFGEMNHTKKHDCD